MIKEIHVFDFDGTLVDSSHRYRHVKGKIDLDYWNEKAHLAYKDRLLPLFEEYKKLSAEQGKYTVIATARVWDEYSETFAHTHAINGHIIARKPGDNRGGAEIKSKGLSKLMALKQFAQVEVVHIYEDNLNYLFALIENFKAKGFNRVIGHYIASNQGY